MWPHNRAELISNARDQRGHQRAHFNDKSSSPDCDSLRAMNVETNFANFWPVYVRAHSRPGTRAIHLAGTLARWMLLVASVTLQRWWCIALALVVSYALAWISHFFVEHNRPATFKHPLWSWWADQKMVALMLTGKTGDEARRCADGN